jgi:hypothetical protein
MYRRHFVLFSLIRKHTVRQMKQLPTKLVDEQTYTGFREEQVQDADTP